MDNKDRSSKADEFRKAQGDDVPVIRAMMAEYMVAAMQTFSRFDISQIKQVAMEIARLSETGISVGSDSQYLIQSIGLPMLSGYKTLAYYYVSVKMACPELLPLIKLPYDEAYSLAQKMYK